MIRGGHDKFPRRRRDGRARDRETTNRSGENMAHEPSKNLQNLFLNHVRKNKTQLTIYLVNGVKLQGVITSFDSFSFLLKREKISQLVYKHAVSAVLPREPINLLDSDRDDDGSG